MKRFIKRLFAILGVIILVFVLVVTIGGKCFNKYNDNEINYENWMSRIDDEVYINDIVIPGSHDAGCTSMNWLGETQSHTIKEQLLVGVRYFDIRVNKIGDKYVIYHNIINGMDFIPNLADIQQFIKANPSEFLLLDFQHFKGDSQADVLGFLTSYLYEENLLVVNDTTLSDLEFINSLKLKDVRGKCIVFWGDRSNDPSNFTFLRNNDSCSNKGMSLNSYYEGDLHKGSFDDLLVTGHNLYFDNIINKINEEGKGIFVLQSQFTDGQLIFGPWSKERAYGEELSTYINNLKDSENLQYINVIMRDFVNSKKCQEIINLNYYKNNMDSLLN